MKIAFIGQKGIPAHGGGIERYADDLSRHIAKEGHEVIVYTRPWYSDKELKIYEGVRLVSLPSIRTKHLDAISHSLLASLDAVRRRVDVIHYQNIGPALAIMIPRLIGPRIKIVTTFQSQDYFHKKWGGFARLSFRLGEWLMIKFSDEVITVTRHLEKYALDRYSLATAYIPNGSNLNEPVAADLINQWGLEKENYIAYIGRLVKHKNVHHLIEAYKRVNTDKKLAIVGDGSYSGTYVDDLKKLAAGNKNILFLGNQTGKILQELYSNTYLFVLPSESEGLSLALLEAMSYRRPVLVSDIPENTEGVGGAGYTFRVNDVDDLEKQLLYALSNGRSIRQNGELARQRIETVYNWKLIAGDVIELYSRVKVKPGIIGRLPKLGWQRVK